VEAEATVEPATRASAAAPVAAAPVEDDLNLDDEDLDLDNVDAALTANDIVGGTACAPRNDGFHFTALIGVDRRYSCTGRGRAARGVRETTTYARNYDCRVAAASSRRLPLGEGAFAAVGCFMDFGGVRGLGRREEKVARQRGETEAAPRHASGQILKTHCHALPMATLATACPSFMSTSTEGEQPQKGVAQR
jgi:hypothetical protein